MRTLKRYRCCNNAYLWRFTFILHCWQQVGSKQILVMSRRHLCLCKGGGSHNFCRFSSLVALSSPAPHSAFHAESPDHRSSFEGYRRQAKHPFCEWNASSSSLDPLPIRPIPCYIKAWKSDKTISFLVSLQYPLALVNRNMRIVLWVQSSEFNLLNSVFFLQVFIWVAFNQCMRSTASDLLPLN